MPLCFQHLINIISDKNFRAIFLSWDALLVQNLWREMSYKNQENMTKSMRSRTNFKIMVISLVSSRIDRFLWIQSQRSFCSVHECFDWCNLKKLQLNCQLETGFHSNRISIIIRPNIKMINTYVIPNMFTAPFDPNLKHKISITVLRPKLTFLKISIYDPTFITPLKM